MRLILRFFSICAVVVLMFPSQAEARGRRIPSSRSDVAVEDGDRLTAGTVQKFIRKGMYSDEVVSALGAPNMVTRNAEGNETWVYDKIHSQYEMRQSDGGLCLGVLGGGLVGPGLLGGHGGIGGSSTRASGSSSERTLTIVIHFDSESRVSDFSYRTTSF
jgi:hypothetical protein